ncbi:MAG TPA: FecR domain-containing protein [Mucilaginibacter sp.]|jgi:transmembrane sensor|nr:FecR domain-containing protein [Mucilaginibacter sp.]
MINNVWLLIGKKLNGEASPEELRELEEILQNSNPERYPLALLEEIWKNQYQTKSDGKLEQKWKAFEEKINAEEENDIIEAAFEQRGPRQRIIKLVKISAWIAAASLVLGLFWFTRDGRTNNRQPNEIIAPKSGFSKVQLPDGTRVWLNAGSRLAYDVNYGSQFRKVSLSGEAFFDVVKDPQHPFIVTTSTIRIKVLGTEFNVRSYNNDKTSEAALVRGRIELTVLKNPEKKIILKASEKLTIINYENAPNKVSERVSSRQVAEEIPLIALSRIHQAKQDTLPSEALWLDNILAFDAEDFESIAVKLQRRYDVNIIFKNEAVKRLRFTGRFQNESIDKALKALQSTAYFHYKIDNNQIIIH